MSKSSSRRPVSSLFASVCKSLNVASLILGDVVARSGDVTMLRGSASADNTGLAAGFSAVSILGELSLEATTNRIRT